MQNKYFVIFRQNDVLQVDIEVKDGVVSTNSNGIYWKLLTPGNYLVKAVVFSRDGKEVTKNDWSNASPSMESVVQKVEVKNTNKSSSLRNGRRAVLEEAKILNLYVKPIQWEYKILLIENLYVVKTLDTFVTSIYYITWYLVAQSLTST